MVYLRIDMKLIKIGLGIGLLIAILLGVGLYINRHSVEQIARQATLPEAKPYETTAAINPTPQITTLVPATPSPNSTAGVTSLPKDTNLAVPFTAQAPHANWEDPYGELCEEASVLMAISYLTNKKIPNAAFADTALLAIKAFEDKRFGFYKDTNAEQTAIILREHFSYKKVEVKQNPTINDIKQALADGRVVLAPVAGREIGNPYFQSPGPLYHMIVIKGYTDTGKFITHDPGTRRGADFLYDQARIMKAIHDWRTDGNIDLGKKVVIIAG